jgi:hypothetical protein
VIWLADILVVVNLGLLWVNWRLIFKNRATLRRLDALEHGDGVIIPPGATAHFTFEFDPETGEGRPVGPPLVEDEDGNLL